MKPHTLIGWRLLGFVLVLAALELYLRAYSTYGQLVVTESSERYGWRMLPDQTRWSREGDVVERINGFGYRDREWDPPRRVAGEWVKDPGVLRVATLGNSMTYGTSVAIEDTWPRRLEQEIARALDAAGDPREALVMSFAAQGYTLEQMALVYEDDVRPFRPDVVIVPLHVGDLLPKPATLDEPGFRYRRPWFRTAIRDLLHREVVGRWIPLPAPPPEARPSDASALKAVLRDDPASPQAFGLWSAAGRILNRMQEEAEQDGGRLAVVVLPTLEHLLDPERLDPSFRLEPWSKARAEARPDAPPVPVLKARAAFGREQEVLSRAILARFGAVEGLPATEKQMRYLPEDLAGFDERLFLEQDVGHYSPRGHRVLAEEIHAQGAAAGLWP